MRPKTLEKFWLDNYVDSELMVCSLCANHGIVEIDRMTPNGKDRLKRQSYCICPNGQQMKKQSEKTA